MPEQCAHCGEKLAGVDPEPHRHQVWEIPEPRPIVDEYQLHRLACPDCGKSTRADLPAGVPSGPAGPGFISHVGILLTKYRMSHRLAAGYLRTIFGVPCSDGWIAKMQRILSESLAQPYTRISQHVREAEVIHIDETSYNVENRSGWLWGAIEAGVSLFRIARSRGAGMAQEIPGDEFSGIVISDRYSSYNRLNTSQRQLCWAHLKRGSTPGR